MAHGELAHEGAFRLPISIARVFSEAFRRKALERTPAAAAATLLFLLNAWICRELFSAGFLRNLDSNEGAFISIARFFRDAGFFTRWFPWFNCGMPIENAYQPLLPMAAALFGRLAGLPIERAFHFLLAVMYCAGPVTLFCFVFDWTRSRAAALAAGLLYTVASPAQFAFPVLAAPFPMRLYNLIHFAEEPHIVSLTLLPLALLFLRRRRLVPAVLFSAAVVLTNSFGAVDLAAGGIAIALAERGSWRRVALSGAACWALISPWLSPSVIALMRRDQVGERGMAHSPASAALLAIVVFALAAWAVRRLAPFPRFALLFAVVMCGIPVVFYAGGVSLVPQAHRYQLEFEMAIAILTASLFHAIPRQRALVFAAVLALCIWPAIRNRHRARTLIQPIAIERTTQYRADVWLRDHLRGERTMVSGDTEYLYNVLSDNAQLSGGHEPTVPNWNERVAIYAFYTAPDAETALLWLKAFGTHALTTRASDHRFDNHLPLLWSDGETSIFEVPHLAPSFAHVVPATALVARQPAHALDLEPLRPYVAALEEPSLPLALITGDVIRGRLRKNQAISVQINYVPGWKAFVHGREIPVGHDAIGLIVLHPDCDGDCEITLRYGVSTEAWVCRALSLFAAMFLIAWPRLAGPRRNADVPPPPAAGREFAE